MEVTQRGLLKGSAALMLAASAGRAISAADDPLPSWNEDSSKKAILDFVNATTDRASSQFVPEPERVAHFRSGRNVVGRTFDVFASCVLLGSRACGGEGQTRTG
jgi:hypothetical protein